MSVEPADAKLRLWPAPRLRALLSAVPDAIVIERRSGAVVAGNRAARTLLQEPAGDRAGVSLHALLPEFEAADPPLEPREYEAVRADGSRFPAEVTMAVIGSRARARRIFVIRDISRRKRLEAALQARQQVLDRTLRLAAAAEMSSAVTHELRQPIAALSNYLHACRHLLGDDARQQQLGEMLAKAMREAERAGSVLRRLQDFFQAGTTHPEELDAAAVVRETLAPMKEYAQRLGITWRFALPGDLPRVRVDRVQFETVLLNLAANALDVLTTLDAARERRIEVTAVSEGEFVRLRIADTGTGIPQELATTLFEPFQTTKPEGMGLGLTISRTLVAANGGKLALDASSGSGACFSFTVRAVPAGVAHG